MRSTHHSPTVPFIEGDGTGPDIWRATQPVLDEAVSRAYGGDRKINWLALLAGEPFYLTMPEVLTVELTAKLPPGPQPKMFSWNAYTA